MPEAVIVDPDGLSRLALVAMVKSSDLRNRHDAAAFWLLHGSRFRSIFGQRQMSSGTLVIGKIALRRTLKDYFPASAASSTPGWGVRSLESAKHSPDGS